MPNNSAFIPVPGLFTRPTRLENAPSSAVEHRKDNPILNSASSAMGGFEYESKDKHDEIKILGVCGGIGSGKSTACKLMVDSLGCVDRIGETRV